MHIHPSSPDSAFSEDCAATIIQAGFRGYRVRKQLRQKPNRRRHHRRQMENRNGPEPRTDRNTNSEGASVEDRSATKIQAGVRGFLVRKRQKIAADAATKIQASFRGFKVRKEMEKMKQKKWAVQATDCFLDLPGVQQGHGSLAK